MAVIEIHHKFIKFISSMTPSNQTVIHAKVSAPNLQVVLPIKLKIVEFKDKSQ